MLAELQSNFKQAIFENQFNDALLSCIKDQGVSAQTRITIHQTTTIQTLVSALMTTYSRVHQVLGDNNFKYLARGFVKKHPPQEAVLFRWGGEFADYIDQDPDATAEYPWLSGLARLEWGHVAAGYADHSPTLEITVLAAIDPEKLGDLQLTFKPSIVLIPKLSQAAMKYWEDVKIANPSKHDTKEISLLIKKIEGDLSQGTEQLILEGGLFSFIQSLHNGGSIFKSVEFASENDPDFDLQSALITSFGLDIFTDYNIKT